MPRIKKSLVQEPFPVLRFPPEIRNHIWRYAIVKEGVVVVQQHSGQRLLSNLPASSLRSGYELRSHREDDQRRVASKLAVAFTCRQIYLEVTPIYYSENTFSLPHWWRCFESDPPKVQRFAEAIGSEKAASILSIHLDNYYFTPLLVDGFLSYFPSLKRLGFSNFLLYRQHYSSKWIAEVIPYVQKHPSMVVTVDGEVWDLPKWISHAQEKGIMGDW